VSPGNAVLVTHAASTNLQAQSLRRLSTQCINTMQIQRYELPSWMISKTTHTAIHTLAVRPSSLEVRHYESSSPPKRIYFYPQGWKLLGTKESLSIQIGSAYGVNKRILLNPSELHRACISEKMSWVAIRTTTRAEDCAYAFNGSFRCLYASTVSMTAKIQ
jgi:hypothetical protein